eukprot:CAMPEP_0115511572 /NCGR_PEP_ID=MMETSP0271-20121206/74043_1 /TAXON_ID=71861 /ORGANISM="Scrippsiella trochoidea, Strain CCMP3099" /LENGTH=73 /DNA_ID=CAMNT_0002941663 /DNA_START=20 /DNA_END=238 /DNA_ORIENTATION=+
MGLAQGNLFVRPGSNYLQRSASLQKPAPPTSIDVPRGDLSLQAANEALALQETSEVNGRFTDELPTLMVSFSP